MNGLYVLLLIAILLMAPLVFLLKGGMRRVAMISDQAADWIAFIFMVSFEAVTVSVIAVIMIRAYL